MTVPADWIEHRRGDGERLGWMRPAGDGFVAINLLGHPVSGKLDWLSAEELLDDTGIGYLADAYELLWPAEGWIRVRFVEVSTTRIRLKKEDGGAIGGEVRFYDVEFPLPNTVRRYER